MYNIIKFNIQVKQYYRLIVIIIDRGIYVKYEYENMMRLLSNICIFCIHNYSYYLYNNTKIYLFNIYIWCNNGGHKNKNTSNIL